MKKLAVLFALLGLFIAGGAWAGPPTMIYPAAGVSTASDCNVAAYYAIGKLCQDTDDGKLYKGTGAGVEEVGAIATDTIWDAAGDTVYGTGANTSARLAKGSAYQLYMMNSGATAPAWTSTLGATGTRLTAGFFTDLTVTNPIAGTITGDLDPDQLSGDTVDDNLIDAAIIADLSATYQPLDAVLTGLSGVTPTGPCLFGVNLAGTYVCASSWPFVTPVVIGYGDTSGGIIRLSEDSDNGTEYTQIKGNDNAETPGVTISGNHADTEDLTITLGHNDNTATVSSSTGVTKLSFSAINLVSTGTISGKIPMITKTDNYTLGTDDAQEAYGYIVWMSGDGKVLTLPAVAAGMSVCLYSTDSTDKVVDPNANDGIRNGTTTRNADGHSITSGATDEGSFVCLVADSADGWTVLGKKGTWTDD
jgi:hypothetical protein